jgi:hypothetical protein
MVAYTLKACVLEVASTHQVYKCSWHATEEAMPNLKLTWLVLGEDPAARSHRVEQFTAL